MSTCKIKITEKQAEKAQARDFRCQCGGLMAKIVPSGIEIKCRRCKRIHCIPFENVYGSGFAAVVKNGKQSFMMPLSRVSDCHD